MIKLKLKRKVTGKQLRELKKKAKRSEEIITDGLWGKTITYKPIPHRRDFTMDHNKPVGRKYPPALYEQKSINVWQAEKLAKEFKKKKQFGKLRRLYKIQPEIDPVNIRKKEHEEKVKKWQAKLKKNQQCQSSK